MSQIYKPGSGGSGGGGIETIAGDIGSITGTNVTIFADNASNQSGATVLFDNSGTVSTLKLSDVLSNLSLGQAAGPNTTNSSNSTAIGVGALGSVSESTDNTAVGFGAMSGFVGGVGNLGSNVALGDGCLDALIDGIDNIAIGSSVANNYIGSESNNIILADDGVTGDTNTIRLGRVSGPNQHTSNYQAGIIGVTVSNEVPVVIDSVTGQLGVGTGGGGSTVNFQAFRTSNQSVTGGSVADTIIYDTAVSNVGAGYNTATGVFTAPSTGFYSFSTCVFVSGLSGLAGNTSILLAYTGSTQSLRMIQQGLGSYAGGDVIILNSSWALQMTAGDTMQVQPFADGTGNYTIFGTAASSSPFNTGTVFSGFKVS
jgi:hypothetical protein